MGVATRAASAVKGLLARRPALVLLQLTVSGVFLFLALRTVDVAAVWRGVAAVNVWILGSALVAKLAGFGFMTLRTRVLSRGVAPLGTGVVFRSVVVAFVGNNVLPFRFGELMRVLYLSARGSLPSSAGLALIFLERVLDTLALALLAIVCFPLLWLRGARLPTLLIFVGAAVGLLAALSVVSRRPQYLVGGLRRLARPLGAARERWLSERATQFVGGLGAFQSSGTLWRSFACTLGFWACSTLGVQAWILAFDLRLPWYAPLLTLVYVSAGVLLPAAPGFLGTYDFFLQQALISFGVDGETATAFALVGHFVAVVPFTLAGLPLVVRETALVARVSGGAPFAEPGAVPPSTVSSDHSSSRQDSPHLIT